MSEKDNSHGSKASSVRLALMLAALALTFFFGSFFFLTD